eukprot:gene1709-2054_t
MASLLLQVSNLRNSHEQSQDASVTMMANLQDGVQGLTDRLAHQVAQLRAEMKPVLQEANQPTLSDLNALASRVDASLAVADSTAQELKRIKGKELPALSASVADLSRRMLRQGHPAASSSPSSNTTSAVDPALTGTSMVERQGRTPPLTTTEVASLAALCERVGCCEAQQLALQGVATQQDLQELSTYMAGGRAGQEDLRRVLSKAVGLALTAFRSSLGDRGSSGAMTK